MKILKNVLSSDTIKEYYDEVDRTRSSGWVSSLLSWTEDIKINVRGTTFISFAEDSLSKLIQRDITANKEIPKCKRYVIQKYIWSYNSSISLHHDGGYEFGLTIYLNHNWNINSGGLFVYFPKNNFNDGRVYIPDFNTAVLNDDKEQHLVTPIVHPTELRYTIQIWGRND